jgi:ankyrin repeat protein
VLTQMPRTKIGSQHFITQQHMGRLECVRLLVDRGADVNYIQEETQSSALQCALTSQHFAVAEFLFEQNAAMGSITEEEKCSALYYAVLKCENDLVKMLLPLVDDLDRVP